MGNVGLNNISLYHGAHNSFGSLGCFYIPFLFYLMAVAGALIIIVGITGIASGAFLAIVTGGPLGILATIFVSMGRREFA